MSNYHILQTNNNLSAANVCYHIAIPDENNSAGINLRTALVYYLDGSAGTSTVPNLENDFAVEYAKLATGEIYEHRENHHFGFPEATLLEKRNEIDARYNSFAVTIVDKLRLILKYYRLDRDVS